MNREKLESFKGSMRDPGYEVVDEGTAGGYGKLAEGSNPSLNVESWSKPEFGAPTTIVSSLSSSHRYAMTTN